VRRLQLLLRGVRGERNQRDALLGVFGAALLGVLGVKGVLVLCGEVGISMLFTDGVASEWSSWLCFGPII